MEKKRTMVWVIRSLLLFLLLVIGILGLSARQVLPPIYAVDISPAPSSRPCHSPYFIIKNTGLLPLRLQEWAFSYEGAGYSYQVPEHRLLPGDTLHVWSGKGEANAENLYAGRTEEVWAINGLFIHGKLFGTVVFWAQVCDPY